MHLILRRFMSSLLCRLRSRRRTRPMGRRSTSTHHELQGRPTALRRSARKMRRIRIHCCFPTTQLQALRSCSRARSDWRATTR
ncbi:hypothetical protein BD309DRAFT_973551, partial [Dichomitus squalens]